MDRGYVISNGETNKSSLKQHFPVHIICCILMFYGGGGCQACSPFKRSGQFKKKSPALFLIVKVSSLDNLGAQLCNVGDSCRFQLSLRSWKSCFFNEIYKKLSENFQEIFWNLQGCRGCLSLTFSIASFGNLTSLKSLISYLYNTEWIFVWFNANFRTFE